MKFFKKLKRNSFIPRAAAVLLTIPMLLRIVCPIATVESADFFSSASPAVCVYFGDTEIYDGMVIDPTGYIHAGYSFTATLSQLAGTDTNVILPKCLNAAYAMSEPIIGTDSKGSEIKVGQLVIDDELHVKVSFFDMRDDTYSKAASLGITEISEDTAVDPDEPPVDPDETVMVEFDVPVIIDTTWLTANGDGSYNVELESGGHKVTVTIEAEDVPVATPAVSAAPAILTAPTVFDSGEFIGTVTLKNGFPKLYRVTGSGSSSTSALITEGTSVSSTDALKVMYEFTMTLEEATAIKAQIDLGNNKFSIPIPTGLKIPAMLADIPMYISIETSSGNFETLLFGWLYVADEDVHVMFDGSFWDDLSYYYRYINYAEGGLDFGCVLDMAQIGTAKGYPVQLTTDFSTIINLEIADNTKSDVLTKNRGAYITSTSSQYYGMVQWIVTYTVGGDGATLPIAFEDKFTTDEMKLSSDIAIGYTKKGSTTSTSITCAPGSSTSGTDTIITYSLTAADLGISDTPAKLGAGDTVRFTYYTLPQPGVYTSASSNFYNYAKVTPDGSTAVTANNYVTISEANKQLVSKSGIASSTNDDEIVWTVTFDTKGLTIQDPNFYDYIGKGLTVTDNVTITGPNSYSYTITPSVPTNYLSSTPSGAPSNINAAGFTGSAKGPTILFIPLTGEFNGKYTVTYTTKVDNEYFVGATGYDFNPTFDNTAWIDFTYKDYPVYKADVTRRTGTVGENGPVPPVCVKTDIVRKSGDYSEDTHIIKWTVTVNPHHATILSTPTATVTEMFPAELEYVTDSLKFAAGNEVVSGEVTLPTVSSNSFDINVSNLGDKMLVFEFGTRVPEAFFQKNKTLDTSTTTGTAEHFENIVDFAGDITYKGTRSSATERATATVQPPSTVVDKTVSYNYDTKTATWKITVNGNKMPMTNAVLTDTLEAYLKTQSVIVSDTDNITNGSSYSFTEDTSTNKITVSLGDICNEKTVYVFINTLVDVDQLGLNKKTSATITNSGVGLTWDDSGGNPQSETSDSVSHTIYNTMLGKDHGNSYSESANTISYQINVNPVNLNLGSDCKLTDNIPTQLRLKLNTVKLYYAKSKDATTTASTGPELEADTLADARDFTWKYDIDTRKLEIWFPDPQRAYILTYECVVDNLNNLPSNKEITNKVTLEGNTMGIDQTKTNGYVVDASAWRRGSLIPSSNSITIKKVNSLLKDVPIQGIHFTLYADIGDGVKRHVKTDVTNTKGELSFTGLSPWITYSLKEEDTDPGNYYNTTAAIVSGENINAQSIDTYTYFTEGSNEQVKLTITNPPLSYDVGFVKVNDEGTRLNGSKFTISGNTITYNGDAYEYPAREATSVNDGELDGVVTFENVPIGTYKLVETAPTPHYLKNTTEYELIVNQDGSYTITELKPDGSPGKVYNGDQLTPSPLEVINTYSRAHEYPTETPQETENTISAKDQPNTGDSGRLFLWKLILCSSAAVMIALLWVRKKKKLW